MRGLPKTPRLPRREEALRATAYHEAGHAVAYYFLRVQGYPLPLIRRATIVPRDDTLGQVAPFRTPSFRPDADISPRAQYRLQGQIMFSLAGAIAEQRHTGRRSPYSDGDRHNAAGLAGYASSSPEEVEPMLRWLEVRTENLIVRYWPFVEVVATALLKHRTLTGRQVRDLIQAQA